MFDEIDPATSQRRPGFRTFTRAIDMVDKLCDPCVLRAMERWREGPIARMKTPCLPLAHRAVKLLTEDPHEWYAGYLSAREAVGFEIPYQMRKDLSERVPQAMLRDIHRLEWVEERIVRDVHESRPDLGAGKQEFLAALAREPPPHVRPSVEVVMAEQRRRRLFFGTPWQTTYTDDAPRNYRSEIPFLER